MQVAEPLIDENAQSYSLDAISRRYGLDGKDSDMLYQWGANQFGGKADKSQAKNIQSQMDGRAETHRYQ